MGQQIRLGRITDASGFFKIIDQCTGRVDLITEEGDRLNLRSKICQFMSMTQIFAHQEELNLELVISEESDVSIICESLGNVSKECVDVSDMKS